MLRLSSLREPPFITDTLALGFSNRARSGTGAFGMSRPALCQYGAKALRRRDWCLMAGLACCLMLSLTHRSRTEAGKPLLYSCIAGLLAFGCLSDRAIENGTWVLGSRWSWQAQKCSVSHLGHAASRSCRVTVGPLRLSASGLGASHTITPRHFWERPCWHAGEVAGLDEQALQPGPPTILQRQKAPTETFSSPLPHLFDL